MTGVLSSNGSTLFWLMAGALLGLAFVRFAARGSMARERRIVAAGLVVAAAIYVAISAADGAGPAALELFGMVAFSILAYAGVRWSPLFLVAGWIGHVAWDVGLHLLGPGYGPAWYATLCVTFDLLVAATVAVRAANVERSLKGAS